MNFDVKFNSTKSVAMRIGKRFQAQYAPLILAGLPLKHVDTVKYLGVHLVAATKWKLSAEHLKLRFYRAFNCIYARCSATNSWTDYSPVAKIFLFTIHAVCIGSRLSLSKQYKITW